MRFPVLKDVSHELMLVFKKLDDHDKVFIILDCTQLTINLTS